MPVFEPFEHRHAMAQQAKVMLRKQVRGVRAAIPAVALAGRSDELQSRVMQLPVWDRARVLCLCAVPTSQRGVSTARLAQEARARGITVAYPRVDYDAQRVEFRTATEAHLESRGLETAEAPGCASLVPPDTIDLIIVPVLAVDPDGYFVGDGSGVYDRALRDVVHATTLAVAFEFQLIPEAPRTSEDVPVAVVVTDRRVIEARSERTAGDVCSDTTCAIRAAKENRRAKQPDFVVGPVTCPDGARGGTRRRAGQCP